MKWLRRWTRRVSIGLAGDTHAEVLDGPTTS
jgi:hypothetical protein